MEFWGVEVKVGETLKVSAEEGKVIHLSQAAIGDSKKGKGENVPVFVKVDDQKLVIGTLSADKFPQIQYDVVFDKDFELSHNWKNGSVFFCGYKAQCPGDHVDFYGDEFDSDSMDEEPMLENGKPTPAVKIEDAKADSDEDSSDDDDDFDDDSDDDEMDADDSEDEDDSSEEEKEKETAPTPKKDDKKKINCCRNQESSICKEGQNSYSNARG